MQQEGICPHYAECSSCSLMHLPYQDQLKLKALEATRILNRAGLGEPKEVVASVKPLRYRARAEIHCKVSKGKKLETGYLKRGSKEIVHLTECKVLVEPCEKALRVLADTLEHYLPEKILLDEDFYFKTALFWEYPKSSSIAWIRLKPKYRGEMPNALRISEHDITPLEAIEPIFKFPSKNIELIAHPNSFTQVNWYDNARLVEEVIAIASEVKPRFVLELHSGVGNFTVHLANLSESVLAIEAGKKESELLKENLETLGINNVTVKRAVDFRALEKLIKEPARFDMLLCDPPRGGLNKETVSLISSIAPKDIVYVSCNPNTLARDLKMLLQRYEPVHYKLLDLFAQTSHIEAIAWLRLS